MFKELLNDIVSENISHKLDGVWLYFPEETLFLVAVGCLQLLLYETRPMLISAKLYHVVEDVLPGVSEGLV